MSSDEAGTSTATGPDVVQSASGGEASQDSSGGDGATRIQFEKDEDTELAGGVVGKAFQGDRHSTGFNEVFNADAEVPEAIGRVRSKFQEVLTANEISRIKWGPVGIVLEGYTYPTGNVPAGWVYLGFICLKTRKIIYWKKGPKGHVSIDEGTVMWFSAK